MLQNIWKATVRTLVKNRVYTLINFAGLTIGLTVALLIVTYVRFELSYDRDLPNANRLYRITNTTSFGRAYALTPPALAVYLKEYFSGIEEVARLYERSVSIKRPGDQQSIEEQQVFFADSTLLRLMPLEFIAGDANRGLSEKFTILITEETALKYFGALNPIGETLLLGGKISFRVAGVVKKNPRNAHFHFNVLVPYDNMYDLETDANAAAMRTNLATNFVTTHSYTYVLLKPQVSPAEIDRGLPSFIRRYAPPERQVGQKFSLMKVTDIHLKSQLVGEAEPSNSLDNLLVFIGVGLITLVMVCINYINLTTAQSLTRVKEISLRKILGSRKIHLALQFLLESFIFCSLSFMLAIVAVYLCLPLLNNLTGKLLAIQDVADPIVMAFSLGLLLFVTLMAGGYPAYFVSRFKSIDALKGEWSGSGSMQWLRKGLVTFQLGVAVVLLTAAMVIINQLGFILSRPLGFEKDQVISIPLFSDNMNAMYGRLDSTFQNRLKVFRDAIEREADIAGTSLSSDVPGVGGVVYRTVIPEGYAKEERLTVPSIGTDYTFIDTYGIKLLAGRSFDRSYSTDATEAFIINESGLREFGWPSAEAALGKTIEREYDGKAGRIIGVVKDFHFDLLTSPVSGLLLDINFDQVAVLNLRLSNKDLSAAVRKIENLWNLHFPEKSFQYSFVDEQLAAEYQSYEQFGKAIQLFTVISIFICALGLYGLVLFTVQRRVKEIGVRKVLGASIRSIMQLLYRDFVLLLMLSVCIAAPLAYWFMQQWLNQFAYRTPVGYLPFALSTFIVLLVILLTVSIQVGRAAMANPIKALRSE